MRELTIRELAKPSEFEAARTVAMAAWKLDATRVSVPADLIAITHAGALTAGAFLGQRLVAFVHGFARTNLPVPAHHSHLLAVDPHFQGSGLSPLLKFYQRDWCLRRRIRLVTWTYDPLLAKNARLNLHRLGGEARAYHRDFYGRIGGIYGAVPTDRFEIFWDLSSERVRCAAAGRFAAEPELKGLPRIRGSSARLPRRLPRALGVDVREDAGSLLAADPRAAMKQRMRLRRLSEELFRRGYAARDVALADGFAVYVFSRR